MSPKMVQAISAAQGSVNSASIPSTSPGNKSHKAEPQKGDAIPTSDLISDVQFSSVMIGVLRKAVSPSPENDGRRRRSFLSRFKELISCCSKPPDTR